MPQVWGFEIWERDGFDRVRVGRRHRGKGHPVYHGAENPNEPIVQATFSSPEQPASFPREHGPIPKHQLSGTPILFVWGTIRA